MIRYWIVLIQTGEKISIYCNWLDCLLLGVLLDGLDGGEDAEVEIEDVAEGGEEAPVAVEHHPQQVLFSEVQTHLQLYRKSKQDKQDYESR